MVTYSFSSSANESIGDKVPDVSIIDPTPLLENSSIATPGLKHHQLKILDGLPASPKATEVSYYSISAVKRTTIFIAITSIAKQRKMLYVVLQIHKQI